MQKPIATRENHMPVYCRGCKGIKTFERSPEGDTKTVNDKVILECWRCSVCGHIARMTAKWD